jgi:alkylation response protein AidB-like acyl-CoA dehydrogenase
MIDFSLTEEQLLLRDSARHFGQKEVKPVAVELDKKRDPVEAVIPMDLYKKAGKLGFTKMTLPKEYGGPEMGCLDLMIVLEEFAAVDGGFCALIQLPNHMIREIAVKGTEEQRKKWLGEIASEDYVPYALAFTEPDAGGSEGQCTIPDPKLGIKTYARRDGDGYVINGSKAGFVTNAGPNTRYFVIMARTDLTKPQYETLSKFIVPADTPGLSIGEISDKLGWRTAPHAEVFLDDVRVPRNYLLGREGSGRAPTGVEMPMGTGIMCIGVARAAFEYAVGYAKKRVTWGKQIINHQAVAITLAEMKMEIEAARYLNWHAAWLFDTHEPGFVTTELFMQKVFAVEMAMRVTRKAIEILGGYGLTTDYPLEKYARDALMLTMVCLPRNIHLLHTAREFGFQQS